MKTEEQDNGDLLIILEPEELKKLGWEENDTINIDNKESNHPPYFIHFSLVSIVSTFEIGR